MRTTRRARPLLGAGAVAAALWASLPCRFAVASSLDMKVIDGVVHDHMAEFKSCYEDGLAKRKHLHGKITSKFVIDGSGHVSKANVVASTLHDEEVEDCIKGVFETLEFPDTTAHCSGDECLVTITYPLTFTEDAK
jgi:hypothetical protein